MTVFWTVMVVVCVTLCGMEEDPLAGPRMLTMVMLLAILTVAALFGLRCGPKAFAANPYQACEAQVSFPVRVHVGAGVDPTPWVAAVEEWNRHYPGSFELGLGDVEVVADSRTWVELPCDGHKAVIHSGPDLKGYAAHELVHTMAVRDFIDPKHDNAAAFVNPAFCTDAYFGIASYCDRQVWVWHADNAMMASLGYRWRLRVAF